MISLEAIKVASIIFLWSVRWLHLDESKEMFIWRIHKNLCVNLGGDFMLYMDKIQGYMYPLIR
jgi:hypothetical protein